MRRGCRDDARRGTLSAPASPDGRGVSLSRRLGVCVANRPVTPRAAHGKQERKGSKREARRDGQPRHARRPAWAGDAGQATPRSFISTLSLPAGASAATRLEPPGGQGRRPSGHEVWEPDRVDATRFGQGGASPRTPSAGYPRADVRAGPSRKLPARPRRWTSRHGPKGLCYRPSQLDSASRSRRARCPTVPGSGDDAQEVMKFVLLTIASTCVMLREGSNGAGAGEP